jgi:hypothetical protein
MRLDNPYKVDKAMEGCAAAITKFAKEDFRWVED